jgi:hypothetical protein
MLSACIDLSSPVKTARLFLTKRTKQPHEYVNKKEGRVI